MPKNKQTAARQPARKPTSNRSTKKPAKKRNKRVASLMPQRGEAAKNKKAAYRLALLLGGGPGDEERSVAIPTQIAELRNLGISPQERDCLLVTLLTEEKNFPRGGVGMRYRIEFAAITLALVISQAYSAAAAGKSRDPDVFAEVAMELAIERGKELWSMGPRN